jgi:hypothetical protein
MTGLLCWNGTFGSGASWNGTAPPGEFWEPNGSIFEHNFPFLEPLCSIWNQSKQQKIESGLAPFHHTPEPNAT